MAHVPEEAEQYVRENYQIIYTCTPIHESASEHSFEPPETCGGCGETESVELSNWVRHHE